MMLKINISAGEVGLHLLQTRFRPAIRTAMAMLAVLTLTVATRAGGGDCPDHAYRGIVASADNARASFDAYMRDGEFWDGHVYFLADPTLEVVRNGEDAQLEDLRPGDDALFFTCGYCILEVYATGPP